MLQRSISSRYYFFALSNFLAAVGGGTILGKGMGAIQNSLLEGGSVLAFFVGTILGLAFLQSIPKRVSKQIARWFSIFASFTSLSLLYVFSHYALNEKIAGNAGVIFFILLSIRFGLWFYARVLRASDAAGQEQRIAWVELGYYIGIIIGLIIWKFLNFNLLMTSALIIDAILQFAAGITDFSASQMPLNLPIQSIKSESIVNHIKHDEQFWGWKLTGAVVGLTIATQVIVFSLSHHVSDYFGPYILAFFYLGVSIAAVSCRIFNFQLRWHTNHSARFKGHAMLSAVRKPFQISFYLCCILSAITLIAVIIGVSAWHEGTSTIGKEKLLLLVLTSIVAFFYEISSLSILDRIGLEEKLFNRQGIIIKTYGLMGISSAISLWLIGFTHTTFYGLFFTVFASLLLSTFLIGKRKIVSA